MSKQTT